MFLYRTHFVDLFKSVQEINTWNLEFIRKARYSGGVLPSQNGYAKQNFRFAMHFLFTSIHVSNFAWQNFLTSQKNSILPSKKN